MCDYYQFVGLFALFIDEFIYKNNFTMLNSMNVDYYK